MNPPERETDVAVVGGGLAGLSAALDLAEAGRRVTLIERRPFTGGKTFSFTDPNSGAELDNGQHITLRCCTAYQALLDRIGLPNAVRYQPSLRVTVVDPATHVSSDIAAGPRGVPAPLHLGASLLRFAHLTWAEKARLGRAVLPLWRMGAAGRRRLDGISFGDWLRAHGQSSRMIDRFWDLIVLPTCNDRSDAVSAQQAIMVFQVGLLNDVHAAEIGVPTVGLSRVANAALERFRQAGGEALCGRAVAELTTDGDRATGVRFQDGSSVAAGNVVLALPPNRATAVLPPAWEVREPFRSFSAFEYSAIVNVHIEVDRPVLDEDFVAVLDPAVQYVFNRSRIHGWQGENEWLSISLSGATELASHSQQQILDAALDGLRRALLPARDASVLQARVVKETEATFRAAPGAAAQRPPARTPIGNLVLAGAWTDTEWPATMESAVRSGHTAAAAIDGG